MSPRPHIETHNRARGHSSVAGAAYRLGVALIDERTGTTHDYRKKSGVLVGHHLAPDNAPDWQRDAGQFWNCAEGAEKRKDAQVARDYRIPVPLGFSQQAAEALALDVAHTIMRDLAAPVSVALHRDNPRDRFGNEKTEAGRGFHAHIYLPARGVTAAGMEEKKAGLFLGLTNCNQSGEIIERWNAAWAAACNRHAAAHGLAPAVDHRSLARMGIQRPPEPSMGVAATAMERRGVATDRGDEVRRHQHETPAGMGHARALADKARERVVSITTNTITTPLVARPPAARIGASGSSANRTKHGDRYGTEALRLIEERNALQAQAARELEAQREAEEAARRKWRRHLEILNRLEMGEAMDLNELDAGQLLALKQTLETEAKILHDWLDEHRGEEARRNQTWQAADERVRRARFVRDEWLRKNPEPSGLVFWRRQQWEEAREKAQAPVETAKAQRREAERRKSAAALAAIGQERSERQARAQEIATACEGIGERLAVLQPSPAPAVVDELAASNDAEEMPTVGRVDRWRQARQLAQQSAPRPRAPRP